MRRKTRHLSSAMVVALTALSGLAHAADTAPLPDGFKAEATSIVPGVFARAVAYESPYELENSLAAVAKACTARGRVLEYVGDSERRVQTTFWLYRNGTDTVVFKSDIKINVDADQCRVTFEETRTVRRSTHKAGAWPLPFSARRLKCSGSPSPCYSQTMFDTKARCRAEGNAFLVDRNCVSIDRGPSRGMLLVSGYEADDMSGSGFDVRELQSHATIDASLFDRSKSW